MKTVTYLLQCPNVLNSFDTFPFIDDDCLDKVCCLCPIIILANVYYHKIQRRTGKIEEKKCKHRKGKT